MKVRNKLTGLVRHAELHAGQAANDPEQTMLLVFEGIPDGHLCRLAFEPERADAFYHLVWANDEELDILQAAGFFLSAKD